MSSLSHHGIKGQKWGVRRYQNKDGTRTALGKHRDFERTASKVVEDLSNSPQPFIKRPLNKDKIRQRGLITQAEADQCASLATGVFKQASQAEPQITGDVIDVVSSTSAKMYGLNNRLKQPTSIAAKIGADAKSDGVTFEQAANGLKDVIRYTAVSDSRDYVDTYNAIKQRLEKKGYTETKCKNYFQKYQNGEVIHKAVQSTFRSPDGVDFEFQFQTPESQAAKELKVPIYNERRKAGNTPERNAELEREMRNLAEQVPDPEGVFGIKSHSGVTNSNKLKHTSIGGTMYIEGNAVILGDSSYLEHHGIRGQRWGVRRFQNRDGSLTNAGRKRLGYATKGATQAVKKAFNAGVKTGAKAIKAAKAHHEKAEAKKIEKKKEKASKTRAGVYANKDLFTAKELKDLNAKFEEQDKLAMARLKKGVEIAKAVGQYAQTAKQIGDAYQSITGKSILGHITEINNKKEADAKKAEDEAKEKAAKDLQESRNKDAAKRALQANIDKYNQQKADEASDARVKDLDKQGNKTAAKAKLAEYIDRYNQDKAAQEQTKQMMKNQKLQEYIDRANQTQREKDAATLKETTERGKQVIDALKRHNTDADLLVEDYQNRMANTGNSKKSSSTPDSGNLMAQIKAAQTKLKKPNKNETPAEHKEAQKKLNALEKVANEYKAAANKPGADPAEITEKLLKKNKNILDDIKHMDFSDEPYLEHYGVRGMKWGKHLMAGKGGGIYDGTALGSGGGGGPMTEEEQKKLEALKKKKEEEARKEQETAEKAKEIGVSVEAYKRYSIDNNRLPGKSHYTKSNKLHNEASASVAAAQAAERKAHMNKAKAASLSRKVNSSHMFDSEGYHISQQRADDRNEAKRLRKEAKKLSKESRRALKKFYKKRYKADKERQKWQNSTSGKYHHMMRHYEIQNGVLFIDESVALAHHGVKGQKWGVRRFQNPDGTLTEKGRKHYEKALSKENRKQVSSDAIRGTLERQHPFAVATSVALGATYAAMLGVASAAAPGAVVAGAAIAAAISGVGTHGIYSVSEAWEGRGTRMRSKKIAKYEKMLKQSDMEEGMYHVENGTIFIDAADPYLEHHGVLGMKWGKHLRAGKGPVDGQASAGGGGGEDDEKLKEMAKKAGMSVAEFKTKMASKISGAASKVGEKVFSGTSPKEKKRVARKDQYLALPEQKKNSRAYDNKAAETRRARAERLTRDSEIFNRAAEESKRKQNSALNKGNKREAEQHGKNANFAQDWAEEGRRGAKDWRTGRRTGKTVLRTDSLDQVKKQHDKTLSGKLDKARHTIQRGKQKIYNAAGGKYKEAWQKKTVEYRKDLARGERAKAKGDHWNASAAGSMFNIHRQEENQLYNKYDDSLAGRYDEFKEKRKKKKAKHFDDTNAIYTEGTRLVVNSKWG